MQCMRCAARTYYIHSMYNGNRAEPWRVAGCIGNFLALFAFSFFYFFPFFIFSPLYAVGNCAVLHGLYIYIFGSDWSIIQNLYRNDPLTYRRREVLCCWLHGCCCAKRYIYILYTHKSLFLILYYMTGKRGEKEMEKKKKKLKIHYSITTF
jgi:hypothetical protein